MGSLRGPTRSENTGPLFKKAVGGKDSPVFRGQKAADEDLGGEEPEKIPPPEPIAPAPEVDDDQVRVSRSRRRSRGRQSTVLTGDLAPEQKKKTTLG
jgi:hypothetical protein